MRKGDAGIVAMVLLMVSAIAAAVLVTNFSRSTEQKVSERIISLGNSIECQDVSLSIENYQNRKLTLKNRGTLGMQKAIVRLFANEPVREEISFKSGEGCSGAGIVNDKFMPNKENVECDITAGFTGEVTKFEAIPVILTDKNEYLGCEERIAVWNS